MGGWKNDAMSKASHSVIAAVLGVCMAGCTPDGDAGASWGALGHTTSDTGFFDTGISDTTPGDTTPSDTTPGDTTLPDTALPDTGPGPGPDPTSPCSPAFYTATSELPFTTDELSDFTDAILSNIPQSTGPEIDIAGYHSATATCTSEQVSELLSSFPCDSSCGSGGAFVLCGDDAPALEAGDLRVVALELAGDIPLQATTHSYIYSVVQDSDGQPDNDWQAKPPFDGDLFQGADRWHQALYDHEAGTWRVQAWQVDAAQDTTPVVSSARYLFVGNRVFFLIDASEASEQPTPYRGTTFRHDGAYSADDRGADVTGENGQAPLIVPPS